MSWHQKLLVTFKNNYKETASNVWNFEIESIIVKCTLMIFYLQFWNDFLQCTLQEKRCRPNPDLRHLAKTLRYPLFRKKCREKWFQINIVMEILTNI